VEPTTEGLNIMLIDPETSTGACCCENAVTDYFEAFLPPSTQQFTINTVGNQLQQFNNALVVDVGEGTLRFITVNENKEVFASSCFIERIIPTT
jgi:hypothetical protein